MDVLALGATSTRNVGLIDVLQEAVPEWAAFPVALLTQLGALWFAGVLIAVVYVLYDRRDALVIAGLLLTGTGIWRTIKIVYPVPRPSHELVALSELPLYLQPVYDLAVVQSGPGFPSGHAVTTTVLYFSFAAIVTIGTKRQRYAVAFFMFALVGATRIALGVHYTLDVIAGAIIGHTVLVVGGTLLVVSPTDRVTGALTFGLVSAGSCLLAKLLLDPGGFWELGLFAVAISLYAWWRYVEGSTTLEGPRWDQPLKRVER